LYLAGMSRIDPTFYEAARIDGASKLRQIRSITLPLLTPIISLNLILNVSGILGSNLDQTLVLMNSQNQNRSEVINSFVYKMGLTQGDFSYATAVGLGIAVISVILLVITDRVTRKLNNGNSVIL
ncbi:ABC transporter permease subunit, partial [Listeria monocytogenes]|nr:ABC transporter permease subunit [Listeria monocytogenes]